MASMVGEFVVKLDDSDRELIRRLAEALEKNNATQANTAPAAVPAAPIAEPAKEAAPEITHEQLQALVVRITATDKTKKAKAREIVFKYAQRVSLINPEDLPKVYAELKELEG